jgi:uncharacterized membrane protein
MTAMMWLWLASMIPWLLQRASSRVALIRWLSPAFWSYALGIVLGQVVAIPKAVFTPAMEYTVVLAIPMLLFSADLRQWRKLLRPALWAYGLWVPLVLLSSVLAYSLFPAWGDRAYAAAMAGSVYIGGTANMAAVQVAIGAPTVLFGQLNLSDLMVSATWLLLVLSVGQRLLGSFLPAFVVPTSAVAASGPSASPWLGLSPAGRTWAILRSVGAGLLAVGLAAGLTFLLAGHLDGTVMLIALTLAGLGGAAWPRIRHLPGSYEVGDYLFLVFCVIAGSLVDFATLLDGNLTQVAFMATVVGAAAIGHLVLAALLRLDTDTVLITQTAGICGPPFIGPVANALRNRALVSLGMAMGGLNLAIGNLVGVLLYSWLG